MTSVVALDLCREWREISLAESRKVPLGIFNPSVFVRFIPQGKKQSGALLSKTKRSVDSKISRSPIIPWRLHKKAKRWLFTTPVR